MQSANSISSSSSQGVTSSKWCEFIDPSTVVEINKVLYSQKPTNNHVWSLRAEKMKLEGMKKTLLARQNEK